MVKKYKLDYKAFNKMSPATNYYSFFWNDNEMLNKHKLKTTTTEKVIKNMKNVARVFKIEWTSSAPFEHSAFILQWIRREL